MIAIITTKLPKFYKLEDYFQTSCRWISDYPSIVGQSYSGYFLDYKYEQIKDIGKIIDYLELHKVKHVK